MLTAVYGLALSKTGCLSWWFLLLMFIVTSFMFVIKDTDLELPKSTTEEEDLALKQKALDIIKQETELAGVRKYICLNQWGHSQVERNIADKILKLKD